MFAALKNGFQTIFNKRISNPNKKTPVPKQPESESYKDIAKLEQQNPLLERGTEEQTISTQNVTDIQQIPATPLEQTNDTAVSTSIPELPGILSIPKNEELKQEDETKNTEEKQIPTKLEPENNTTVSAAIAVLPPIKEKQYTLLSTIPENETPMQNNGEETKETVLPSTKSEQDNSVAISAAIAAAVSQLLKKNKDALLSTDKTSTQGKGEEEQIQPKETTTDNSSAISTAIAASEKDTILSTNLTNETSTQDNREDTPSEAPVLPQKEPEQDNSAAISAAIAAAVSQLLKENKDDLLSKDETPVDKDEGEETEETVILSKEPEPDNNAAVATAIAAAVSHLLKQKPELLSTQLDKKNVVDSQEDAVSSTISVQQNPDEVLRIGDINTEIIEQSPDNDNAAASAAAAIASANNAIESPQKTTSPLPDKSITELTPNGAAAAVAISAATNQESTSEETKTEDKTNERMQSESAAIAVATTPTADTTAIDASIAAAIASSQQENINTTTNVDVDERQVEPASNSTNVTETTIDTTPIAAAIASSQQQNTPSQTVAPTQQNIIPPNSEPESNPNITAALAAAIGAALINQPATSLPTTPESAKGNNAISAASSSIEEQSNGEVVDVGGIELETIEQTQDDSGYAIAVAAAIAAAIEKYSQQQSIGTPKEISTTTNTKSIINGILNFLPSILKNITSSDVKKNDKETESSLARLTKFLKSIYKGIPEVNIRKILSDNINRLKPNKTTNNQTSPTLAKDPNNLNQSTEIANKIVNDLLNQQSSSNSLTPSAIKQPQQQTYPDSLASSPLEQQPTKATEDTVIIYNNIVYQKDPTDPTQIIETFHKKNEQGVLEPHTRIIKLEDGTTAISVKDKNEWKPLDLSEYGTLDAKITTEGILKALRTFAAAPKQSGGSKSSHREEEKEQDDDASPPQIIKDDYTTTLIYKNLVYTSIPNEKWIQENYFIDDREDDSAPKNRKLRLTDSNKLELEDGNVFDIAYYDKRDNLTESKIIDMLSKMGQGQSLRRTPDA